MPPSLLEIIQRTAAYFEKAGLETPRLDAEWLIAGVIGCKRLELFLKFDRPMEDAILDKLRPLVRRRAQREPLQHILGTVDFAGLTLKADQRALIPRPETEDLIELIRDEARKPPERILDLGTGSGAIALALAALWPEASIIAVDRSAEALSLARENAELCSLNNITWREGSWFEGLDEPPFDLIVSNPPYLTEAEWESAQPEVKEFDPKVALVAADAGLVDLREILAGAKACLCPGGLVALETGIAQHTALMTLAEESGFMGIESKADASGRDRYFFCRAAL
jgi:release factor glutamine methyltransferase|tara:strand:+ start:74601 stop:75449 length:849 start_codon:yes stop_codon:yes gene_type:complete